MTVAGITGATLGFLFLGIVNWMFSLHLSFSHVLGYGVAGGFVAGLVFSYMAIRLVIRWARKKIHRTIMNFPSTRLFKTLRRA